MNQMKWWGTWICKKQTKGSVMVEAILVLVVLIALVVILTQEIHRQMKISKKCSKPFIFNDSGVLLMFFEIDTHRQMKRG